ncbi:MAG: phenylacetate-CoA oxygenase subunit PaaI [Sphingobacteriales bacterium]|nr:MAG: phenylacetate-CoA oxygenase subunit PaaI [Sphingobacteriales bacterium]
MNNQSTSQPVNQLTNQLKYTLQIADTALIHGHRLSEWCGHGPVLEQDIALSNMALDHLGQSRSLYQHAAEIFNALPAEHKKSVFTSAMLNQKIDKGEALDEDDLAYLRDGWDFYNVLLAEQPNGDWAYTIVRSFFLDVFNYYFFSKLISSTDEALAAVAEKSLKEVTYHMRWSSEWMIRLGDGTAESHQRVQEALNESWMFSGELLKMNETEKSLLTDGISVDLETIKAQWLEKVSEIVQQATLDLPKNNWMQEGGKEGRHTEHLGFVLAEMQFMQRAYPDMEW